MVNLAHKLPPPPDTTTMDGALTPLRCRAVVEPGGRDPEAATGSRTVMGGRVRSLFAVVHADNSDIQ